MGFPSEDFFRQLVEKLIKNQQEYFLNLFSQEQANRVLTFEQGCKYLGYAKSYVHKLTSAGILPYSKPNGKSIFFDREKLENWMLSNPSSSYDDKINQAATYVNTNKRRANNG